MICPKMLCEKPTPTFGDFQAIHGQFLSDETDKSLPFLPVKQPNGYKCLQFCSTKLSNCCAFSEKSTNQLQKFHQKQSFNFHLTDKSTHKKQPFNFHLTDKSTVQLPAQLSTTPTCTEKYESRQKIETK